MTKQKDWKELYSTLDENDPLNICLQRFINYKNFCKKVKNEQNNHSDFIWGLTEE